MPSRGWCGRRPVGRSPSWPRPKRSTAIAGARRAWRCGPWAMSWSGRIAGAATGLIGMPGPPVVIYLIAVGAPVQMGRATQMAFFALVYAATLAADAALHGVPGRDWVIAVSLMPTTAIGALIGTRLGNHLNENSATILAIAVLGAAGLYTLAAAVGPALR